jgi:LicD family protein
MDSGSLLGLYRDGHILSWDDDIDIGMWKEGIEFLSKNRKMIRSKGYSFSKQYYNGRVYSITLKDLHHKTTPPVHVHGFFRSGSSAWSPQVVACQPLPEPQPEWVKENPNTLRSLLLWCKKQAKSGLSNSTSFVSVILKFTFGLSIWGVFYAVKEPLDRKIWDTVWPFNLIYRVYTWVIPSTYFENLNYILIDSLQIPIPNNTENYLSLRYGDWNITNRFWYYWRDDKTLEHASPVKTLLLNKTGE